MWVMRILLYYKHLGCMYLVYDDDKLSDANMMPAAETDHLRYNLHPSQPSRPGLFTCFQTLAKLILLEVYKWFNTSKQAEGTKGSCGLC